MSKIQFVNTKYDWKHLSLITFINEGNIPKLWEYFFIENSNVLLDISNKLSNVSNTIYPNINKVFRAFIKPTDIKVVILGQDPYHNSSAVGYCFSVLQGNTINPSLKNIYKELQLEGYDITKNGLLYHWVKQGCFMLNTALTVEKGKPDSHTKIWHSFTKNVIRWLANNRSDIVWLLMGTKAHRYRDIINNSIYSQYILRTSHPSPFSAYKNIDNDIPSFIGSNVFRKINSYLDILHKKTIKW